MKKQVVLSGLALASLSIASGCHINFNSVRYNVDFYVDGELYQSVGTDGKTIEMPKEPTKDGYQFGGWYTEENGEGDLITLYTLFNQPLSTNIRLTIHAHFLEELTVSFVTGTNEIIEDVTYVEGDTISALTPEIAPEDKLFGGWFTDEQCTQKWDYDAKLETDMTFYAGWISKYVTITYIYNLEGVENTTVQATRYERTAEVVPDKRDDGTFIGWYTDERFTIAWDFSKTVDSDLTLYANWYSKYVTVTFDFQHEDLENQKVKIERGEKISEIIPNKTPLYHEFKEWRYEGKKWDFNSPVEKDMTLSASWKNNTGKSVSVVYVLFSGSKAYGSTKIGSLVEDMSEFQYLKEGERFAGWFTDENFTQPWDILNDRADKTEMTLYAKVEKISYTLSFETQGLDRLPNISVNHGETIELPLLYKEDYYLSAWEGTREDGTTFMIEKIYRDFSYTHRSESNIRFTPHFESIFTFEKISSKDEYALTHIYAIAQETIRIPSIYNGLPVTRIEEEACRNNNYFKKLVIPDSVTYIGKSAFYACYDLTEVTIGSGVTEIDSNAFSSCSELVTINFTGNNLKKVGGNAFSYTKVQNLTFPDSLESLGSVSECESLSSIYLGKNLKEMGTFYRCTALKEIRFPASLQSIPGEMFSECDLVVYVEAESKPDGWHEGWNFGNMPVVWDCTNTKMLSQEGVLYALKDSCATIVRYRGDEASLTIPEYVTLEGAQYPVTIIGLKAFYMANNLVNLSLPNTLERVDYPQFIGCNNLTYYHENGVKYLGNAENPYLLLKDITMNMPKLTVPAQTRIILGHDPKTYYTVYNVGGVEFEEGSQLQYMGPDFFDWDKSYGQSDDIFLPKGIKYMASNAWHGGRVNVFVPEESKPEGWADDWCSASNEIIYGVTKDNVVTIGDAVYVLYDNEAMLLHLRNTTNTYSLPETVVWDGKEYALTKMGNWCISSIQSDLIYLAIPATVTKIVTTIPSSTQYTINVFLFEMDHDSSGTLPSNSIFGVTAQDYIMQEEAHFIRRGDYAEAYRFLWKGDPDNPNVYVLPQTVKALDDEIPVSHISRNFLGTLSYVQLYFYNTVTDIPKGKTYGYGVSIYTEHDVAPKGWETDWNECYGGSSMNPKNYMPVTYGVTGLTEGLKTYTFMENGEELKKFTAQFAPSAPILSVSGKYFWGWYDNAEFTGNVIEFPYVGESTSFYARFENTQIQDGKSQDTAYVLKVGSYMPVEITKPGQTVYFQYTVEKEQTYTFKSRGDYDTIGRIYYMKRVFSTVKEETVASADSGGSGENFSMTQTLLDITYYFTVKLVDSTETGSFEVILSAL